MVRRFAAALAPALLLGCEIPTDYDSRLGGGSFVETHRGFVTGIVRGDYSQRLRDVEIILRFPGSTLPPPTTYTDAFGEFTIAVALYNGPTGADSAAATIYAIASPPAYTQSVADHAEIMVYFAPIRQASPRTIVNLRLPVF